MLYILALLDAANDAIVSPKLLLHLLASFALDIFYFRNLVLHSCNAQVAKLSQRLSLAGFLQREV